MPYLDKKIQKRIDDKLALLNSFRPLPVSAVKKLKEQFVSLAELAKSTKFTEKYLNLLARSGKIEAHKEERDWLSSKEALRRYLDGRERKRK